MVAASASPLDTAKTYRWAGTKMWTEAEKGFGGPVEIAREGATYEV